MSLRLDRQNGNETLPIKAANFARIRLSRLGRPPHSPLCYNMEIGQPLAFNRSRLRFPTDKEMANGLVSYADRAFTAREWGRK